MSNFLRNRFLQAALTALVACLPCAAWALLPIEHWQQADGAQVWLIHSPDIPMLGAQIQFPGGLLHEPPDKPGLHQAHIAMSAKGVQAQGKQAALDENALGQAWADLGATFAPMWDRASTGYLFQSLTEPDLLAQAVDLAARQMAAPLWPETAWQRDRQRAIAALKEEDTRPPRRAAKAFARALYGSHPYGRQATPEGLARLQLADIAAFHRHTVVACRARVALVGAINRAQADALVTRLLAPLRQQQKNTPAQCTALPKIPAPAPLPAAQRVDIAFEAAQAQIFIGQPVDISRASPHYFAALAGNHILGGGGFTSRLTAEVREKRGLSYSVYSRFAPADDAAQFSIGLQTRPDQAAQALDVAQQTLRRFIAEGPSAEELQSAKDNLIGSFALRVDSNDKLLMNLANIAAHGLPLDYLEQWSGNIEKLTVAEVKTAMQRFLALYPEYQNTAPLPEGFHWKWYFAFHHLGDESVADQVARYRAGLLTRQSLTERLGWILPGVGIQTIAHRIAATDLNAQLAYQDQIVDFHRQIREFYYPYLFNEQIFSNKDFINRPQFVSRQNDASLDNRLWGALLLPWLIGLWGILRIGPFRFRTI